MYNLDRFVERKKGEYMRHIPNILTFSRIVLAIALIFIYPPLGVISIIVYSIAGGTDMIDGFLARRIPNAKSKMGAELDSIADLVLAAVGIFVFLPVMQIWDWFWMVAIGMFAFKILLPSISSYIKYRQVLLLHTISNKVATLLLFICPIIYFFTGAHTIINIYVVFLIGAFCWAITEETLINLTLKKPNPNIRGIWKVREENSKAV